MLSRRYRQWVWVILGTALGPLIAGSRPALAQATSDADNLIFQLKDKSPAVRRAALKDLQRLLAWEAAPAAPEAARLLKDPDRGVRREAVHLIFQLRGEAKGAVPLLIELLNDPDKDVRYNAVHALRGIGPEAKDAVPELVKRLIDPDLYMRGAAAKTLAGPLGFVTKDVITARLVELLKDPNSDVRRNAIEVLGGIGAETKDAVPVLIDALRSTDSGTRRAAGVALGRIHPAPKGAVPHLLERLKDGERKVRLAAVEALGRIGPAAEDATRALAEMLKDSDPEMREKIVAALGQIESQARNVSPELVNLLKDSDKHVRAAAADALGRIGAAARSSIAALAALLTDPDQEVRGNAAEAVGRIAEGLSSRVEFDAGTRRLLENALEIIETHRESSGRALEATRRIERAIHSLRVLEADSFVDPENGLPPALSFKDWKAWFLILLGGSLLTSLAIFLVRRFRMTRPTST